VAVPPGRIIPAFIAGIAMFLLLPGTADINSPHEQVSRCAR